jgi:phosphoglycolate phosphatase-like HAD superfamily hydrolase
MKLVMFDIDGTLTNTYVSDENEFVRAIREVLGLPEINTDWASYHHVTSEGVLNEIALARLGRPVSRSESRAVQRRLVELLSGPRIAEIPGAGAFLRRLFDLGYGVSLASGDWEFSARHKLAAASLPVDGLPAAFCDSADARTDIMRHSRQRALRHYRCRRFEKIVYVGDAGWDVRASRELGWEFVGIASGQTPRKLRELGARHVFPDFLKAEAILAVLAAASISP